MSMILRISVVGGVAIGTYLIAHWLCRRCKSNHGGKSDKTEPNVKDSEICSSNLAETYSTDKPHGEHGDVQNVDQADVTEESDKDLERSKYETVPGDSKTDIDAASKASSDMEIIDSNEAVANCATNIPSREADNVPSEFDSPASQLEETDGSNRATSKVTASNSAGKETSDSSNSRRTSGSTSTTSSTNSSSSSSNSSSGKQHRKKKR